MLQKPQLKCKYLSFVILSSVVVCILVFYSVVPQSRSIQVNWCKAYAKKNIMSFSINNIDMNIIIYMTTEKRLLLKEILMNTP